MEGLIQGHKDHGMCSETFSSKGLSCDQNIGLRYRFLKKRRKSLAFSGPFEPVMLQQSIRADWVNLRLFSVVKSQIRVAHRTNVWLDPWPFKDIKTCNGVHVFHILAYYCEDVLVGVTLEQIS